MTRWLVERRLTETGDRLRALRDELRVVDEQLAALQEQAEDAHLRALVAETPLADADYRDAKRHADAMAGHRAEVATRIADLERRQDALLDQLIR